MKKKIFIRADGNSKIGLGHVVRTLALASMLPDYECTYLMQSCDDALRNEILKVCTAIKILPELESVDAEAQFIAETFLDENAICVLDGYQFNADYQKILKKSKARLVYIDDLYTGHFYADAVINHSPAARKEKYTSIEPYTRLFLGLDYALLRAPFLKAASGVRDIRAIETAFICMGGADPWNVTGKALAACTEADFLKKIHVVTGSAFTHAAELEKVVIQYKGRVHWHENIHAEEMVRIMEDAQLAIVPSSSVALEVFSVGMEMITGYFAENQVEFSRYIHENSLGTSVGSLKSLDRKVFKNALNPTVTGHHKIQKALIKGDQPNNIRLIFDSL